MPQSRDSFREAVQETVLAFLWRAWCAMGVAGQDRCNFHGLADPEALVVFTLSMARYDARLFDAVLEWLVVNGRFVSPQRLRLLLKRPGFRGQTPVQAAAAWLDTTQPSWRWQLTAAQGTETVNPEPLFLLGDGRPLPVVGRKDALFLRHGLLRSPFAPRGVALPFPPHAPACLWLRLRALFGVGARADILAYLLSRPGGHAREIARRTGYAQRTIQDALSDMERSGWLAAASPGHTRAIRMGAALRGSLLEGRPAPSWKPWPELLEVLEALWWKMEGWQHGGTGLNLNAEILVTVGPMLDQLARAGMPEVLDLRLKQGPELVMGLFGLLEEHSVQGHAERKTG
jgi:hypothetical protein